jgi:hypothetical protein
MAIEVKHGTGAAATAAAAFGGAQGQARGRLEKERIRSYERQKEAERQRRFTAERDQWLAGEKRKREQAKERDRATRETDEKEGRAQEDRLGEQNVLPPGYDPDVWEWRSDEKAIERAEKNIEGLDESYHSGELTNEEYEKEIAKAEQELQEAVGKKKIRRKDKNNEIDGRKVGETFRENGFVWSIERDSQGNPTKKKDGPDPYIPTARDIREWQEEIPKKIVDGVEVAPSPEEYVAWVDLQSWMHRKAVATALEEEFDEPRPTGLNDIQQQQQQQQEAQAELEREEARIAMMESPQYGAYEREYEKASSGKGLINLQGVSEREAKRLDDLWNKVPGAKPEDAPHRGGGVVKEDLSEVSTEDLLKVLNGETVSVQDGAESSQTEQEIAPEIPEKVEESGLIRTGKDGVERFYDPIYGKWRRTPDEVIGKPVRRGAWWALRYLTIAGQTGTTLGHASVLAEEAIDRIGKTWEQIQAEAESSWKYGQ